MSGRSPGPRRALAGAPCLCLLQRCLAVHLQKLGLTSPRSPPPSAAHQPDQPLPPTPPAPSQHYWMYDSGYLVFQGFLEANQKCFWNPGLLEAVRVLEFQGYVAPGVLLVRANPCALEVVRAAWARNVLKAPANYVITSVGDVEDCLIQPISQGQFTPLAEALCWVVLDLTSSGQVAVLDTIRSALHLAFPEIQRPSKDLVYDTLAKLMTDNKLYQTSRGYFVVTPESRRLRGGAGGSSEASSPRPMLLSTDEAVALVHGEMATVLDGERTHQAIQTNLADVICGGNPNDKVLYARSPAKRAQLERRHSLRLFGSNKRLTALQRSGSMRHIPTRQAAADTTLVNNSLASSSTFSRKSLSLLSRIFRRSKRGKAQPLQTFSAQFPPTEWFNSRVRHLHSVGTQTQAVPVRTTRSNSPSASSGRSRANSSSRSHLLDRGWDREADSTSTATLPRQHRRQTSASASATPTPTPSRAPSRRSSPHPSPSRSSLSSSKTVVNTKSMSSASSGYNSLPRSTKSPKTSRQSSAANTPKSSPVHSTTNSGKSSITLQVSTNQNKGNYSSQCDTSIGGFISSLKSSVGDTVDDNSTTMTTTINGNNTTKIFVQQQNSPVRSIITFENGMKKNSQNHDLIILNGGKQGDTTKTSDKDGNKKNRSKLERPSSLYAKEDKEDTKSNEKLFGQLETQLKMKFPSSETIQLEEKLLTSTKNNKNNQLRPVFDSTKIATGSLIDVTNLESELNNVRKASISCTPLQSYNKTENLSVKNLLKEAEHPFLPLIMNKEAKNFNSNPPSPTKPFPGDVSSSTGSIFNSDLVKVNSQDLVGKKDGNHDLGNFPSLSDLSLHFTSLAAQNILKGVSINSIDTLVEVNMAAEKQNNREVTVHTDFGVV